MGNVSLKLNHNMISFLSNIFVDNITHGLLHAPESKQLEREIYRSSEIFFTKSEPQMTYGGHFIGGLLSTPKSFSIDEHNEPDFIFLPLGYKLS